MLNLINKIFTLSSVNIKVRSVYKKDASLRERIQIKFKVSQTVKGVNFLSNSNKAVHTYLICAEDLSSS
jgi:hypothetical protein